MIAASCDDLKESGEERSGIYILQIGGKPTSVYCDMDDDGGGWTVLLKRFPSCNPPDYFDRNWAEYQEGFGRKDDEFWLGLDAIHHLTTDKNDTPIEMKITFTDFDGESRSILYKDFRVWGASEKYRMTYSNSTDVDSGKAVTNPPSGARFSTFDQDNDAWYLWKYSFISCNYCLGDVRLSDRLKYFS